MMIIWYHDNGHDTDDDDDDDDDDVYDDEYANDSNNHLAIINVQLSFNIQLSIG